ncbi:MAG: TRAFs-binding domain-containing protein [Candidatus Omnitrophota bacterium]
MNPIDQILQVFEGENAEDILTIAMGRGWNDPKILMTAAQKLRNLMYYSGIIKLCERVLELNTRHVEAMELKALALGRIFPEKRGEIMELLERVVFLAREKEGNAAALLGRIHKEMWRMSWYRKSGHPSLIQIEENIILARRELRYLQKAVKNYLDAFLKSDKQDCYSGLNAVTLLQIEMYLLSCNKEDQAKRYGEDMLDIGKKVYRLSTQTIENAENPDERYWALVSHAELTLMLSSEQPNVADGFKTVRENLLEAISLPGQRWFALDSTIQQFQMLSELGIQTEWFIQALELLETAWRKRTPIFREKHELQSYLNPKRPLWLYELFDLFINDKDKNLAERWKRYKENPNSVRVLSELVLKWEPIEQLTPPTPTRVILGFEILGTDICNSGYGNLLRKATSADIDITDMNIALMALGLRYARLLRILMQQRKGLSALKLFFSMNFDYEMLQSPALIRVLKHYFSPEILKLGQSSNTDSFLFFEVSEKFPSENSKLPPDPIERKKFIDEACECLKKTLNTYNLKLVLDDANNMDPYVRESLKFFTCKTKADSYYTRNVMKNMPKADAAGIILEGLSAFAVEGKPYVIEGIENADEYNFLEVQWTHPETGIQGWHIKVNEEWVEFFDPILDNPDQPGGYRLQAWVEDRLGLY